MAYLKPQAGRVGQVLKLDLEQAHATFMADVLPYAGGNLHPGFMGWVQGAGTPVGMLAEKPAGG